MDAIWDLHKEWGELVARRQRVRAAPYDKETERDLIARLLGHQAKLGALRAAVLEDEVAHPRRPRPAPMRAAYPAH